MNDEYGNLRHSPGLVRNHSGVLPDYPHPSPLPPGSRRGSYVWQYVGFLTHIGPTEVGTPLPSPAREQERELCMAVRWLFHPNWPNGGGYTRYSGLSGMVCIIDEEICRLGCIVGTELGQGVRVDPTVFRGLEAQRAEYPL